MRTLSALLLASLHGAVRANSEPASCGICNGAPGTELDPEVHAGIWDGKPYTCRVASFYLFQQAQQGKPCEPDQAWVQRCCKAVPAPMSAPTPAPTPAPAPRPACDICPGSSVLRHHYAGRDARGLYTCARAVSSLARLLSRVRSGATCQGARRDWRSSCCANAQPKCNLCPRGRRDVDKWASAGRWTGQGQYRGRWVTCNRAGVLLQQETGWKCKRGRRQLQDKCCRSRR